MKYVIIIVLIGISITSNAQLYSTRNGFAGFYSETTLENIVAENNQVYAIIDVSKKTIAFTMLMKGFVFKKELMQEHFNENYIESDKYPKANFTGSFTEAIDPSKNGKVTIHITGQLTMHGVTKPFSTAADINVANNTLDGTSNFSITPSDFNIEIPSLVREKIAKQIDVKVKVSLHP